MPYRQESADSADAWRGEPFQRLSEADQEELRKAFPNPRSGEASRLRMLERITSKRQDSACSSRDARLRMIARINRR